MSEEPKQRDVTRKELADALAESQALNKRLAARLDALEAKPAPTPQVVVSARMPDVTLIPYKGLVKALAPCCLDTKRETGEIWEAELPALWSDDPYEPVVVVQDTFDVTGVRTVVTARNPDAPPAIHKRFRKLVNNADEDQIPRGLAAVN